MTFDDAFVRLVGVEGSYQPDPGGLTGRQGDMKFGLKRLDYPMEDIEGMTVERAKAIYLRDFWGPAGCDALPGSIRFAVFEMAVMAGVRQTVRTLQKAVGERVDGEFGPHTLQAVQTLGPGRVAARFNGARLAAMTDMPGWRAFGNGWARRIAKNLMEC
jgi:lysozyme family protein